MEYAILQDHESMRYYIVPYEDADDCTETCDACGESDWFITSFNTSEYVPLVIGSLLTCGLFSVIEEVLSYFNNKSDKEIALAYLEDYKHRTETELKQVNEVIKKLEEWSE